ncbi:MAG: hypothetical protein ACOVP5_00300 [Chitinophagales bacterium]|jgi:hypothetical protein
MFEKIINSFSLIIAFVSLVVSLIALNISKDALYLSSAPLVPTFEYDFSGKNEVIIKNEFDEFFEIVSVGLIEFDNICVEYKDGKMVNVPFITESKNYQSRHLSRKGNSLKIDRLITTPCFETCSFNEELLDQYRSYLDSSYALDSEEGYLLPSMQTTLTILAITYKTRSNELKSTYLYRSKIYGTPEYDQFLISEEEFDNYIKSASHPKFTEYSVLKEYFNSTYFNSKK